MMKKVKMELEQMPEAREAFNSALQRALMIMHQKNVNEVTTAISIKIELDTVSAYPRITYKTTIRVPMEITDKGTAVKASQIYWDEDLRSFALEIDGEQVKIDG